MRAGTDDPRRSGQGTGGIVKSEKFVMKILKYLPIFVYGMFLQMGCAQVPTDRPQCKSPDFDKKVSQMLDFSVPLIGVEELKNIQDEVHIFDAREAEEYQTSRIENAQYIGYNDLNLTAIKKLPKDAKIVVYCSIGYRSEKIGEQLQDMGYTNVYNLYGSIFEWVNNGYGIVDQNGNPTSRLHTYNRKWSKWVEAGKAEKVW